MTFNRVVIAVLNFFERIFGPVKSEPAAPGSGEFGVGYVLDASDVAAIESLVALASSQPEAEIQ